MMHWGCRRSLGTQITCKKITCCGATSHFLFSLELWLAAMIVLPLQPRVRPCSHSSSMFLSISRIRICSACGKFHPHAKRPRLSNSLLSNTLTGCNFRGTKALRRYADGEWKVNKVWPRLALVVSSPVHRVTAACDLIKLTNRMILC